MSNWVKVGYYEFENVRTGEHKIAYPDSDWYRDWREGLI